MKLWNLSSSFRAYVSSIKLQKEILLFLVSSSQKWKLSGKAADNQFIEQVALKFIQVALVWNDGLEKTSGKLLIQIV